MKAGRELDALVAEKVMGYCLHRPGLTVDVVYQQRECTRCGAMVDMLVLSQQEGWSPSADIAEAWQVWEKVSEGEETFANVQNCCRKPEGKRWCAIISREDGLFEGQGDTAAVAICLAALKAVGVEASS